MLRRLSGAASGGLRLSLSSPPSRPPRALIQLTHVDKSGVPAPGAPLHLDEPPFGTNLTVPANFVRPRSLNDSRTCVHGSVPGQVGATSSDGFLLVRFWESRFEFDVPTTGDHRESWVSAARDFCFNTNTGVTRFVCNPLSSGELYRLPDLDGAKRTTMYQHLGFHTQSQGGHGPPDRYAVAEMFTIGGDEEEEEEGIVLRRFLSETGKCEKIVGLPPPLPAGRRMHIDIAMVPLRDRLWWIDKSWGAISVDPLSERLKLRLVKLPSGSVLPHLKGVILMGKLDSYRCSEGKMLYMEMLDKMPTIGALDPLNSNVVYLVCGNQLLGMDMVKGKLIGTYTWLESSKTPYAGWSNQTTIRREASAPPPSSSPAAPPSPPHVRFSLHALPRPKLARHNFSTAAKLPLDAEDSSVPLNSDDSEVPLWWWPADKRESIWKHKFENDQEGSMMHPFDFVAEYRLVDSIQLKGEMTIADIPNAIGDGLVSSMVVLLEEMKQHFCSFYDPITVDSFCIDPFGKVQIASGVLLRLGSKMSSTIDTYFAANVLELLLSHGRTSPVHLPEVADLLELMRSPWRLQGYALLIHTAGMPDCERGHALINAHVLVMEDLSDFERRFVLSLVDSDGWGVLAVKNLLLELWFYHSGVEYDPDDPEDHLVYCRNSELHVFSHCDTLLYTKQDYQYLMRVKFWRLLCQLYLSLWKHGKIRWLRPEQHFCSVRCCPVSLGCARHFCFLNEQKMDKAGPDPEWAEACLRIIHRIQKATNQSVQPRERSNKIHMCYLPKV